MLKSTSAPAYSPSLIAPAAALLLLAGCTASLQGPPAFVQLYGTVDQPCAASKTAAAHCTADIMLVNRGGEGVAHVTIAIPVKDASASSAASPARIASAVKCGMSIPDTIAGGDVDLACAFDLPSGKTIAGAPILLTIDFMAAAGAGSAEGDLLGIATLGLAAVAAVLAALAFLVAIARLRPAQSRRAGRRPDSEDSDTW